MSQKLSEDGFSQTESTYFTTELKKCDEGSIVGYILETDINYPGQMGISHNKLPFLPSKMKINKKEN